MGRGIVAAVALLVFAAVVYGVALLSVQLLGRGGLDGPCQFAARDPEGATLSSQTHLWPPGYTCISRGPDGEVTSMKSDEVGWVSPFVIASLAGAVVLTLAGIYSAVEVPPTNRLRRSGRS